MNVAIIEFMEMKLSEIRQLELNPTGGAPDNGKALLKERSLFLVIGTIDLTRSGIRNKIEQIIGLTSSERRPQINMYKPAGMKQIDVHGQLLHSDGSCLSNNVWKDLFLVLKDDELPLELKDLVIMQS